MAEYIEREAVVRELNKTYDNMNAMGAQFYCGFMNAVHRIKDSPAADVAPVRHGRWIGCNGEIVDWDENNPGCPMHSCFCSICKSWLTASDELPVIAYFCPNCGAKMDGYERKERKKND